MKQWHVEHMEKTVVKYVSGLAENASSWERKQHKRYCNLANVCKQIDYDIKHGVTKDQVTVFLQNVRNQSSFAKVRNNDGSIGRLDEIEQYFQKEKVAMAQASPQSYQRLYYNR